MNQVPLKVESTTLGPFFESMRDHWHQTETVFYVLLALMLIDTITGLLVAWKQKRWNSTASFDGFRKKSTMLLSVVAMIALSPVVPSLNLALVLTTFYVFTEALSIIENSATLGVYVPQSMKDVLSKLRESEPQRVTIINTPTDPVNTKDQHEVKPQ